MSLKIEVKDSYSEDLKRYINDYNSGVELQDLMEVNLAIDGILMLIFHTDQNLRNTASIALIEIANKEPRFLKKGIQVLLHRYKGSDVEKSEFASVILGKITRTLAIQLITDPAILNKIIEEHYERVAKEKFNEEEKQKFAKVLIYNKSKMEAIKDKLFLIMKEQNLEILTLDRNYLPEIIDESFLEYDTSDQLPKVNLRLEFYLRDNGIDIHYNGTLISLLS